MSEWTDEKTEMLKRLWADDLSASQIAAFLGGVTRNAVIGKVHRLGLNGRAKFPSRRPACFYRPRAKKVNQHAVVTRPPTVKAPPCVPAELEIPLEQRKTLLQLDGKDTHYCHWPVGDPKSPDFFYCGAEAVPHENYRHYCAHHLRMLTGYVSERRPEIRHTKVAALSMFG